MVAQPCRPRSEAGSLRYGLAIVAQIYWGLKIEKRRFSAIVAQSPKRGRERLEYLSALIFAHQKIRKTFDFAGYLFVRWVVRNLSYFISFVSS